MNNKQKSLCLIVVPLVLAATLLSANAETPKLNIKTKHNLPAEEQRKEQMERLAKQYDLKKYTITRDILIQRGAMNHSHPTLTLNLRFLDNDDLALSAYVHEQGHWVLTDRTRPEIPRLFEDLGFRRATANCAAAICTSPSACSSGKRWKTWSAPSALAKSSNGSSGTTTKQFTRSC